MLAWFSVTPIGTGSPSVSAEVAAAVDAVAATGISHTTDPTGTLLEGDWDACTAAIRAAADAVLDGGAARVSIVVKFDVRRDQPDQTGAEKLARLQRQREGGA